MMRCRECGQDIDADRVDECLVPDADHQPEPADVARRVRVAIVDNNTLTRIACGFALEDLDEWARELAWTDDDDAAAAA